MLRDYSFIPVSILILGGLGWWSFREGSLDLSELLRTRLSVTVPNRVSARRELIEVLDRAITYQHYYHSVYETYSDNFKKIGFRIPLSVIENYDVQIVEADAEHVFIHAYGRQERRLNDIVQIDQDYHLQANFQVPLPRVGYLKKKCIRHLRLLEEAPKGRMVAESGIFAGFFEYFVEELESGRFVKAVGIKYPVKGLRLELNEKNRAALEAELLLDDFFLAETPSAEQNQAAPSSSGANRVEATSKSASQIHRPEGGATPAKESFGQSEREEAQLAQIIFRGEVGRYAKDWAELSKVAQFPDNAIQHEAGNWEAMMQGMQGFPPAENRGPHSLPNTPLGGKPSKNVKDPLQFEPL